MIKPLLAFVLVAVSATAPASERSYSVGSFDRLRVDGPFEVRVTTGGAPRATVSGEPRATDNVDVRVEGTTLVVRRGGGGWGEQMAKAGGTPLVVTLSTPNLVSANVIAGGRVTIMRMRAMRIDISVSGAGSMALTGVDVDQLNATVIGTGAMALKGRAARARLITNGPGVIDASALDVGDLTVRLDGVGNTKAQARFTADVTNTGLGTVTIVGGAKCSVKALAGGPVICGPKL